MTQIGSHLETDVAIIGAGPSGLFMVFQAGFLGYRSVVLDALPQAGGQLAALYPEKPIYDVPGYPVILAGGLVDNLLTQAAPYQPQYLLGEPVEELHGSAGNFLLTTAQHEVAAKVVVIAGGSGMFTPRKPQVPRLEEFEHTGDVLYAITNKKALAGQRVVIAGGGDSAVDWAVELAGIAAHVHLVHRRPDFRAAEEMVRQLHALAEAGKVTIHTPYQVAELTGVPGALTGLTLRDLDGTARLLEADKLVCCFGLAPNAGPLANWELGLEKGLLPVDRATMETRRPGILCIGDMGHYDGKVALILTGFAEATVAARQVQAIIHPDKKFKVQYSTSKGVPGVV